MFLNGRSNLGSRARVAFRVFRFKFVGGGGSSWCGAGKFTHSRLVDVGAESKESNAWWPYCACAR